MANKTLTLYDGLDSNETITLKGAFDTSIEVRYADGTPIFKKLKNKVIIPGSGLIARKLFDLPGQEITPSYNDRLNIITPGGNHTGSMDPRTKATPDNPMVLLFCCGLNGCGTENSQVYPVDYRKWIQPSDMIPLRYQLLSNDLSPTMRESYFGRSVINGDYAAYYFKRFEGEAVLIQQYIDGTLVDGNIYDSVKNDSAETYVEILLKITKEDIRDYFIATVGIDEAKVNSISLCTAWPQEIDNVMYFNDIRPLTKLNIPNEPLIDLSKGIDIIYHIYM